MASFSTLATLLFLMSLLSSIAVSSSRSINEAPTNVSSLVSKFTDGGANGNDTATASESGANGNDTAIDYRANGNHTAREFGANVNDTAGGQFGGTRWAALVAGSTGYSNYRHQAYVCHAYQLLKEGGLKEENIVVFMYDDIAYNEENPQPGIIINKPEGRDVYHGVPKDYNGADANINNFFAVLLGNTSVLVGGSGKVLKSGPNDHVFIYYTDHGAPGFVTMPPEDLLCADDLIRVLKQMHAFKMYKSMVFYLEACESGSRFEGLLPSNLNIYAVTASNSKERRVVGKHIVLNPGLVRFIMSARETCSVLPGWKTGNSGEAVKKRTTASHVMQYGDETLEGKFAISFLGAHRRYGKDDTSSPEKFPTPIAVDQRDASLVHFQPKVQRAEKGSDEMVKAQTLLQDMISRRSFEDESMSRIAKVLLGDGKASEAMELFRPSGEPLVDDWDCLKSLMGAYQEQCGTLSSYGKKYARGLANMCNAGVNVEQMNRAVMEACPVKTA